MKMKYTLIIPFCLLSSLFFFCEANAFTKNGCGDGSCIDCHKLSKKESASLLSISEEHIVELKFAEVPGFWEIDIRQSQQVVPVFIDFSKQYLISGSVVKIDDKKDITRERFADLNRIDVSQIPLEDALIVGDPAASTRIIVFDDPQCPYCLKLQTEMRRVVEQRPDIAFDIKMFPLKSHPEAYDRAKAIICTKSLTMLEESLAGKDIRPSACETDVVDRNLVLAKSLNISTTPTLVMPDGRVMPGYRKAENIIGLIRTPAKSLGENQ